MANATARGLSHDANPADLGLASPHQRNPRLTTPREFRHRPSREAPREQERLRRPKPPHGKRVCRRGRRLLRRSWGSGLAAPPRSTAARPPILKTATVSSTASPSWLRAVRSRASRRPTSAAVRPAVSSGVRSSSGTPIRHRRTRAVSHDRGQRRLELQQERDRRARPRQRDDHQEHRHRLDEQPRRPERHRRLRGRLRSRRSTATRSAGTTTPGSTARRPPGSSSGTPASPLTRRTSCPATRSISISSLVPSAARSTAPNNEVRRGRKTNP